MGQIPLALRLHPYASFSSYVAGDNGAAVEHVKAVSLGQRRESVWLTGSAGTGKSHLLAAACRAAGDAGAPAMYLAADPSADPGILTELDQVELLAIDDMHRIAGSSGWEAALFAVLNDRLERGRLLLAADSAPRDCDFGLADLESRAALAVLYRLNLPGDEELVTVIQVQAEARGFDVEEAAARYLLTRISRNMVQMMAWLDRVDRFALAAKRAVTVPLLRQLLETEDAG